MTNASFPATLRVDLDAIRANTARIADATSNHVMAVVKANGYGAGLVPSALAALDGGATFLGVAHLTEALALRESGITAPVLAWLHTAASDFVSAVADGIEIGISDDTGLDALSDAHRRTGAVAKAQLKIDTGLGRNGVTLEHLPVVLEHAKRLRDAGRIEITGAFMHFAYADQPHHPTVMAQQDRFAEAVDLIEGAGFNPKWLHVANSAAVMTGTTADRPWNMVRPGLALYGYSPMPDEVSAADFGLRPALRLTARLSTGKLLGAGSGVSYGHLHVTEDETIVGVVPIGYADGIPRAGTNRVPVLVQGRRTRCIGRVCMDQFMIDLGQEGCVGGQEVVLFGDPAQGEPSVEEWAQACDTISYEIITRLGWSIPRRYVGR